MPKLVDLTGRKFNKLTVIKRADNDGKFVTWLCECECGNTVTVRGNNIKSGNTSSCGCNNHTGKGKYKHGLSDSRLYSIWEHMKARCNNKHSKDYSNYGLRGIKVCEQWNDNFKTFKEWALSNGYNKTLTIDRINNNEGYNPSNCRWVERKTQNNNTRRNIYITYNGVTMTLSQWTEKLNLSYMKIYKRLKKGQPFEEAIREVV